ncbi:MAG TPA: xanthine dehydrogenase small subunit [Burkholderiaceae bacterium]|nr:xanthine dehydrogenase small subunit [Burkholderiaceae bacterium]
MAGEQPKTNTEGGPVRFLLGGEVVEARDVAPTKSVLNFLREDLRRKGTKEGCAEGDCGACTVVVGELNGNEVQLRTVNACIQFVPTLDGKALFTVEDLRCTDGCLHPVQQAMVDCHGSQCGFCTPGFVMSLWNVYNENVEKGTRPGEAEVRNALTGNLCRCTGYRPILEAGQRMFDLPHVSPCDRAALAQRLRELRRDGALAYERGGQRFFAPRTLAELVQLRAAHPQATVLAGCTDVGLWVNKQLRDLPVIIYIGEVAELKRIEQKGESLTIGAGVSLTDAYGALCKHYPEMKEMWERFASVPIRNAGTLGGNVANGSPIGDSMPGLIALGSRVVLHGTSGRRTLNLEDLYVDYMQKSMRPDEIVEAIEVPLPAPELRFRTYKLSKRYDSDISAVCAAFALRLDGDRIASTRVAFGGVAAIPKRAPLTERALTGQVWNEATARAAMAALAEDYAPISDMRATASYRLKTAQNLLYRCYLETRVQAPLPATSTSVFASVFATQ